MCDATLVQTRASPGRTRRKFSPEEKMRIVLEGLRGEQSVSELCRREGIAANLCSRWSKDFLEARKKQLVGDLVREAASDSVGDQREVGWSVGSARRRIESRARP